MNQPITIVDADPSWAFRFELLAAPIRESLGRLAVAVEHVGSTAVAGLAAKPIIDLDIVVRNDEDLAPASSALIALGYRAGGERGVAGRWIFDEPAGSEPHHVFLIARHETSLWEHLAFRDALRADHQLADRYESLKRRLAAEFRDDRVGYTDAKSAFIHAALPCRVVSLVPSATETLIAWGVRPVACTRFCEQSAIFPVGGTKNPDIAAIAGLRPDVVIVDREENRAEDASALEDSGLRVHAMHVDSLSTLGRELSSLAQVVGAPAVDPLDLPPRFTGRRRRALIPIWREPWMTIGGKTYGSELLSHIGFDNVWADVEGYPELDLAARPVDVVLAPTEPYAFKERHLPELSAACGGAPAVLVDGQDLFWWGSRTTAAIERLTSLRTLGRSSAKI